MLGAQESPLLGKGEWQFTLGYRGLNSEQHYRGTHRERSITSGVVNSQHIVTLQLANMVTEQLELNLDVPVVWNGFSLLRPVPGGGAARARQAVRSRGLSDIALQGRYWLLDADTHPRGNVALELGVKFPTGRSDIRDDVFGQLVPVDQSIQPGDSGFGFSTGIQGFTSRGDVTLFGSGTYLFNPKNTSGTATFFGSLGGNTTFDNSVPDQFLGRVGVGVRLRRVRGLSLLMAGRIEGIPVSDAIGESDGFRRPGYVLYAEPGLAYSRGRSTYALTFPVRVHQNIKDSPSTVRIEDSTVPDYLVLFSYSRRFGGRKAAPPAPEVPEAPASQAACAKCGIPGCGRTAPALAAG